MTPVEPIKFYCLECKKEVLQSQLKRIYGSSSLYHDHSVCQYDKNYNIKRDPRYEFPPGPLGGKIIETTNDFPTDEEIKKFLDTEREEAFKAVLKHGQELELLMEKLGITELTVALNTIDPKP